MAQDAQPGKRKYSFGPPAAKKQRTRYVWLNVLPDDLWLKVREGVTVWEALQKTDVELDSDCGGLGKCGKCKVKVLSSVGPPSKEEDELLAEQELNQGIRLACRTRVGRDFVINIGEAGLDSEYFQILKTGLRPLLHPDPLICKRLIALPVEDNNEGLSDFDRIKLVMVPEYQDLRASLHCLQTLPGMLQKTQYHGTAVLHENLLLAWQKWEDVDCYYGLVFDLGTSTLVGKLINLVDGSEAAVVSSLNSQMKYGTNVISRLQFVRERPNGLDTMHALLVRDLNRITSRLLKVSGLKADDVFIAVVAGNTTMQHFLLRLDPSGIAEAPFAPVLTDGFIVKASSVGLRAHPEALIYVMPTKSGYIGGDLVSVILASGAAEQDNEIVLGLDLGTNGEIFLGNRNRLMTCSAAAGPALEGARISSGMIAKAGAIESVRLENGDVVYSVIGNINPRGICGSGLVELVAALVDAGVVRSDGLLQPREEVEQSALRSRIVSQNGVNRFLIASAEESYDGQPIYLTQKDVRELQLAKAAIAAGIRTLVDEMGLTVADIHHVYLAGALGNYIRPHSAARIGMIPGIDADMVTSIGNAASTGASMVLLSKYYWQMANSLSDSVEHIELSTRLDFNGYFVEHMDFPGEVAQSLV